MTPTKQELLDHYAAKPVQRFVQVDGFVDTKGDPVVTGDEDGDCLMTGVRHELMRSPGRGMPLRVLIHEDAELEDVRRLLTKILENVDHSLDVLTEPIEIPF